MVQKRKATNFIRKTIRSKRALPTGVSGMLIVFALIGIAGHLTTHAATAYYALDAEKGTVAAPASVVDDSTAGSSQAVRFGTGSSTSPAPTPTPTPQPSPKPTPTPVSGSTPWGNKALYVEPAPGNTAKQYLLNNPNATGASLITRMGNQPIAKWFGAWNGNVQDAANQYVSAAASAGQVPMLVLYNIPSRDCGGFSAGGTQNEADYATWVSQMAAGVNGRQAIYIIEPDAISLTDCLNSDQLAARWRELSNAVQVLSAKGNAYTYIESGHPNWVSPSDTAARLKLAGIASATGIALNTSNYTTTADNITFGNQVSALIGNKHYVIDTSRNGNGPTSDNQWCNPPGRALGKTPTAATGTGLADAFLWVKTPWASDGACNGGPAAGEDNWPYAIGLAQAAGW